MGLLQPGASPITVLNYNDTMEQQTRPRLQTKSVMGCRKVSKSVIWVRESWDDDVSTETSDVQAETPQ